MSDYAREKAFEFTDKHSGVSSFDVEALISAVIARCAQEAERACDDNDDPPARIRSLAAPPAGPQLTAPAEPRPRTCTCLGTCKGPEGLAKGWVCAMGRVATPPAGVGAETGHQTGSAQLRCIAPLGDDDTVGPRCPGYCDVYEAGEGGRCTRVCAASRVDDGTEDAQADEDATLLNAGSGGSWSVMRGAPAGTGGGRR